MKAIQHISLLFIGVICSAFATNNSLVGSWQLVKIFDVKNEMESFRPVNYSSEQLTFQFEDNGSRGMLSGYTISNKVTGKYTLSDSTITVTQFGGTKIVENGWGSEIWSQLKEMESFHFKNDSLIISTQNHEMELYFISSHLSK